MHVPVVVALPWKLPLDKLCEGGLEVQECIVGIPKIHGVSREAS